MQESQTWVGDQGHKHVDDVNIIRDLITAGCRKQAREGASKPNNSMRCSRLSCRADSSSLLPLREATQDCCSEAVSVRSAAHILCDKHDLSLLGTSFTPISGKRIRGKPGNILGGTQF